MIYLLTSKNTILSSVLMRSTSMQRELIPRKQGKLLQCGLLVTKKAFVNELVPYINVDVETEHWNVSSSTKILSFLLLLLLFLQHIAIMPLFISHINRKPIKQTRQLSF